MAARCASDSCELDVPPHATPTETSVAATTTPSAPRRLLAPIARPPPASRGLGAGSAAKHSPPAACGRSSALLELPGVPMATLTSVRDPGARRPAALEPARLHSVPLA